MHRTVQKLVDAQVSINRAVFEANKAKADEDYLTWCIAEAFESLSTALADLARRGKRK
jgi:hypothetical protein